MVRSHSPPPIKSAIYDGISVSTISPGCAGETPLSIYTYDDEGRVIAVDSGGTGTYVYNADGLRSHRVGSVGPEDYIYDLAGHAAETYSEILGTVQRVEVYAGAMQVATYDNNTTYFGHTDWQRTERVRSGVSGTAVSATPSIVPFRRRFTTR